MPHGVLTHENSAGIRVPKQPVTVYCGGGVAGKTTTTVVLVVHGNVDSKDLRASSVNGITDSVIGVSELTVREAVTVCTVGVVTVVLLTKLTQRRDPKDNPQNPRKTETNLNRTDKETNPQYKIYNLQLII